MKTNEFTADRIDDMLDQIKLMSLFQADVEVLRPLLGVEQEYIETAFETAEETYGSLENYIREGLEISDEEIIDRCILALINEGADILSEGVAQRAADIDVVYINGYGFPIWRGGPMHHANAMGLDVVVEKLKKYHEITGNNAYKPSELLIKLAKNGEKFSEAPLEEERKEKLNFAMSSVAGNF